MKTTIIKTEYLEIYSKKQPISLLKHFNKIKEIAIDKNTFGYSVSVSSVYSSMIEGNPIDLDSYLSYAASGMNTKSKSYKEITDLFKAYEYAAKKDLNLKNFLQSHAIMSKTLISDKNYSGKIRDKEVYIFADGLKVYTGASKLTVDNEIKNLFEDIYLLLNKKLTITEVFYYASMLHLVFAKIHPFADGNGRSARLLEKWFLVSKLGEKAWHIPSEKLYQTRLKSYYKNIDLGKSYETNNYNLSLPFLLMLPMSLRIQTK
ncbi:MAG: Fic family protein [Bacteroidales bacterium]